MILFGLIALGTASAQPCDVTDGESIQSAIDDADPYTTLHVCEGTYKEKITLDTNGLHLSSQDAHLHGDLLSEGHGITLEEHVRDITIEGFHIHDYDPLVDGNISSGIASHGHTANVTLSNNTITDNAWAGIMLTGPDTAWSLHNNTVTDNGFAAVYAHQAHRLALEQNTLKEGQYGALLDAPAHATLTGNTITGDGHAGIAITPSIGTGHLPDQATITGNTVQGTWTHGLWTAGLTHGTLEDNTLHGDTANATLAGDPTFLATNNNTGDAMVHTAAFEDAQTALQTGPDDEDTDPTLTELNLDCGLDLACTTDTVSQTYQDALLNQLNPLAQDHGQDHDRLAQCQGENATCLREAFFHANDTGDPREWTIDYATIPDPPIEPGTETLDLLDQIATDTHPWAFTGNAHATDRCEDPPTHDAYLGFHSSTDCTTPDTSTNHTASRPLEIPEHGRQTVTLHHAYTLDHDTDAAPPTPQLTLEIRPANGTWTPLKTWNPAQAGSFSWTREAIDVSPYAGDTVDIRLTHDPDDGAGAWMIDTLRLTTETPPLPTDLEGATLEFIDAGMRTGPDEDAWRHHEAPLEQAWTPLVLCRLHLGATAHPCQDLPRTFDYGLPLTWEGSDLPQRISQWRLFLPTDGIFDTFDRVHGPDATLFRATTTPHYEGADDPHRAHATGILELECLISPTLQNETLSTQDCSHGAQTNASNPQMAHDPWDPGTPGQSPIMRCEEPRPDYDPSVHLDRDAEEEALWDWSTTCEPDDIAASLSWDAFLTHDRDRLENAHTEYAFALSPYTRHQALQDAKHALENASTRDKALNADNLGLPTNEQPLTDFDAIPIVGPLDDLTDDEISPNSELLQGWVLDEEHDWVPVQEPALLVDTPAKLEFQLTYTLPSGETIDEILPYHLGTDKPHLQTPQPALYADTIYGTVHANNTAHTNPVTQPTNESLLDDPRNRSTQSIPYVTITHDGEPIDEGLAQAGYQIQDDLDSLEACVQDLHTGNATGIRTNLDAETSPLTTDRLAIDQHLECLHPIDQDPQELAFDAPLSIALQLRYGDEDAYNVSLERIHDPTKHPLHHDDPLANRTLEDAISHHEPDPLEEAIEPVSYRLIVTAPENSSKEQNAQLLADLIHEHAGTIGIFSAEIDDLPAPRSLKQAVEHAVTNKGTTVLTGAGTLPPNAHQWPVEEKLLTIHGLAAHPLVLTVGATDGDGRVANWTRLGPTALSIGPKPDLVAPSPAGTTVGAVQNILPYAEALNVHGITEPLLLRAILGGYAIDATSQEGTPATYWEQGMGLVDLSRFLDLPTTDDLLETFETEQNLDPGQGPTLLATRLDTTEQAITTSAPPQILGPAANTTGLVRAGVSESLVNLTIDSPALPGTSIVDFGVTHHETPKKAGLDPIDLDPLLNATANTLRATLLEAGYTGTQLDETMENLTALLDGIAQEGQLVTANATHYRYGDMLTEDYLYTGLKALVQDAVEDDDPLGEEVQTLLDRLITWELDEHHLVQERHETIHLDLEIEDRCLEAPVAGAFAIGDAALSLTHSTLRAYQGTAKGPVALDLAQNIPRDSSALISSGRQDFITEQARQLTCLEDIKAALEQLIEWVDQTRELQRIPYGAWNQTEAATGAWNMTPLGHQIANTTDTLETPAHTLAENTTIVMDTTSDALVRALELTEQKLDLLALPHISAKTPGWNLTTDPDQTSQAPLGGYAGLATLTSHNVTVHNPLDGSTVAQRNITIPLPSLLWNNPTLEWKETYRDSTPINETNLHLTETTTYQIPLETNFTSHNDTLDVYANLSTNATERFELEQNHTTALLEDLENLSTSDLDLPEGASLDRLQNEIEDAAYLLEQQTREWGNLVNCSLNTSLPDNARARCQADALEGVHRAFHQETWSRAVDHNALTDQNGEATLGHLFPGSYELLTPYPYHLITDLDRDYEHASPGEGWLEGPLLDADKGIHEILHHTNLGLWPQHPTAEIDPLHPDPEPPSYMPTGGTMWDFSPYTEIHGTTEGPFHPFAYELEGADLLGALCLDSRWFTNATNTPITFGGCGAVPFDGTAQKKLHALVETINCLLGQHPDPLRVDETIATTCTAIAAELNACLETSTTCHVDNAETLIEALQKVKEDAQELMNFSGEEALFPHVRSPARALHERPAEIGFSCDALIDQTRNDTLNQHANLTDEDWCQVIEDALDAVSLPGADRGMNVDEPPRVSTHEHVTAQGILHHTTDRVSGLDWHHLGTATETPLGNESDEQDILDLIDKAYNLLGEGDGEVETDEERIAEFENELDENVAADQVEAWFDAGLALNTSEVASFIGEGWRSNGTVHGGSYVLNGTVETTQLKDSEVCDALPPLSGVPEAYLACSAVLDEVGPSVEGYASVDTVSLANALLEEIRYALDDADTEFVEDLNESQLEDILTTATGLAAGPPSASVDRTEDGFRVEQDDLDPTPLAGALYYTTPLPPNEHLQLRMDGELFLDETAALMVHTANPLVAEALAAAGDTLRDLDVQNLTDLGYLARTLEAVQTILDQLPRELEQKDPLIRAQLYGFPLKVEQRVHTSLIDAEPGTHGDCPGTHPARWDMETCTYGFAALRPDGYYDLSRTYEMDTKQRGGTFGPDTLHTVMLYFPSTTDQFDETLTEDALPTQKLVLSNFSIQQKTYIGVESRNLLHEHDDESLQLDLTGRIGYRANVEDYKQLWAVPDQPPTSETEPGLETRFSTQEGEWTLADEDYIGGGGSVRMFMCPQSNTPGYPTGSREKDGHLYQFDRAPGGMKANDRPFDEEFVFAYAQPCVKNSVWGARPVHITSVPVPHKWMSSPGKALVDTLQYTFNVDAFEQFTHRSMSESDPPLLHPLNSPPPSGQRAPIPYSNAGEETANQALSTLTGSAGMAVGHAHRALNNPLFELGDVVPFMGSSWKSTPQGAMGFPIAKHDFAVLNESRALDLMSDPWDPHEPLTRTDTNLPERSSEPFEPETMWVHGHQLPLRELVDEHSFVAAHSAEAAWKGESHRQHTGNEGKKAAYTLFGNGRTGVGLALEAVGTYGIGATDMDRERFLDGLRVEGNATFTVRIHELGGLETAGSNCGEALLYGYVAAHYRCTGIASTHTEGGAVVQAGGECYDAVLDYTDTAYREGIELGVDAVDGPAWFAEEDIRYAMDLLTREGLLDVDPTDPRQIQRANEYRSQTSQLIAKATEVIACLNLHADALPGFGSDRFRMVAENATRLLQDVNHTAHDVLNMTAGVAPSLYETGEEAHSLFVRMSAPDVRSGYLAAPEDLLDPDERTVPVEYAVEELMLTLDNATLALTNETTNQTTVLDTIQGPLDEEDDRLYTSQQSPLVDHGSSYTLALEAAPDGGENASSTDAFLVDLHAPTIDVLEAPENWINATTQAYTVELDVHDATSGLAEARLEVCMHEDACPGDASHATATKLDGPTDEQTLELTVPLDAYASWDEVHTARTIVTDQAGNQRQHQLPTPTLDYTLPSVEGDLLEDAMELITEPPVQVDFETWDDPSGLADITVHIHEITHDETPYTHNVDLDGDTLHRRTGLSMGDELSTHNGTYRLHVHSVDEAGNRPANATVATRNVQVPPVLDPLVPGNTTQQLLPFPLSTNASTHLPGFETIPVDEVTLTLQDNENETVVDTHAWTNTTGTFQAVLDETALENEQGYTATLSARHGIVETSLEYGLWVAERDDYQLFSQPRAFANLTAGGEERWQIDVGTSCGDEQALSVLLIEQGLDLYVARGSADSAGADPGEFSFEETGNASVKQILVGGVDAGDAFTVLVDHPSPNGTPVGQYQLAWWTYCHEASQSPEDSEESDPEAAREEPASEQERID